MRDDLAAWLRLLDPGSAATHSPFAGRFRLAAALFGAGLQGCAKKSVQGEALCRCPANRRRRSKSWPAPRCLLLRTARDVLCFGDAAYPRRSQDADPPLLLYVQGRIERCRPPLAMVGSRNPTAQGSDNARPSQQPAERG